MSKIFINLNPQKKSAVNGVVQSITRYTPLVGLVVVVIFIFIAVVNLFIFYKSNTHNNLNREWSKWEEKTLPLRNIKSEIAALEAKKNELKKISTPKYDVVLIMSDLFSSMPKNIWMQSIDFKQGSIVLTGVVVKWREDYLLSLDKLIDALKDKEYFYKKFTNIAIKKSKNRNYNNVEVLEFIIQCKK